MDKYEQFKERIGEIARLFSTIDKREPIRLVSHLDSDGISSASILIKALNIDNRKYTITIVHQLTEKIIGELSREDYKYIIFTDIGSGQFNMIAEKLSPRTVFILDHHKPQSTAEVQNIRHLNPHLFNIDGSKEISGAGVVYLFVSALNKQNESMAHIAVIGAIGDLQENDGFRQLNNEILEMAVAHRKIQIKRGPRFFGIQTKPIHKVLEYSTDPYIPGVTGSESRAIQFLLELGINPKNGNDWKKIVHLTEDEMNKLITGIIMRRLDEKNPEDVLGNIYVLLEEERESPLRDAKEFSTLLNACGRMNKASLGIGACIGDKTMKRRAINHLTDYRKEIITVMKWYEEHKKSDFVEQEKHIILINAKEHVMPTMIGTLASILAKSNYFEEGTFVIALARNSDGTTKVSFRISDGMRKDLDLRAIITGVTEKIGGESGGHRFAAGANIKTEDERTFIGLIKEAIKKTLLEEKLEF